MTEEEFQELIKELEKLPEYLAEKKRLYYEHQNFIEKTMADAYEEILNDGIIES